MKDQSAAVPLLPKPAFAIGVGKRNLGSIQEAAEEEEEYYRRLETKGRTRFVKDPEKPDWFYAPEVVSPYVYTPIPGTAKRAKRPPPWKPNHEVT